MDIAVQTVSGITIVALAGEVNAKTAPEAQDRILAEAQPKGNLILDMSRVTYMSSAGLRMMLKVYRTVNDRGGRALLAGLTEDVKATMALTGFLDFFKHCDTLQAGLAELGS